MTRRDFARLWLRVVAVVAVAGFTILAITIGARDAAVVLFPVIPIVGVWFVLDRLANRRNA